MRTTYIFYFILLVSCGKTTNTTNQKNKTLKPNTYRGELGVKDQKTLPFIFKVTTDTTLTIYNADENINVDEITYENDSVYIKMPAFEGFLVAKINTDNTLNGYFKKEELNRSQPFTAKPSKSRFDVITPAKINISGDWETTFSPNTEDSYIAKGSFTQKGNIVTGTFRTKTGDYRYLEGVVDGNELKLSTLDGAHAFLFTAKVEDSIMNGTFYSGNHFSEPFTAKRNDNFELPDANTLTFLKEGYDTVEFTFPDETGKNVSLSDERFKDKVVLVQIMGTWCPNCLDESKFYSEFYKHNKNKPLEIVGLAFEYAKTKDKAFKSIQRLKDKLNIDYPILLAQTGTTSKKKANEKLPMLNHVLSYPTTIFIDKKGKVRKIHTGFNGPATGNKYLKFKEEFNTFVSTLLNE